MSVDGERMLLDLAVVGYEPPGEDGSDGAALVLHAEAGTVARFDREFTDRHGTFRPLYVSTVEHVIPADPGWFALKVVPATDERAEGMIGEFPVIAWVTTLPSSDDAPGGDAIVLVEGDNPHCYPGPIRQSELPGVASYRPTRMRGSRNRPFQTATARSTAGPAA